MAPVGFFLFRNQPEDYHLLPDGDTDVTVTAINKSIETDPIEENWTLKEAIRTRTFWMLAISLALFSMLSTGLFFHLVSIFENRGPNPSVAASVFFACCICRSSDTINSWGSHRSYFIAIFISSWAASPSRRTTFCSSAPGNSYRFLVWNRFGRYKWNKPGNRCSGLAKILWSQTFGQYLRLHNCCSDYRGSSWSASLWYRLRHTWHLPTRAFDLCRYLHPF